MGCCWVRIGRGVVGGSVLGNGADVQEVSTAYSTTNASARATVRVGGIEGVNVSIERIRIIVRVFMNTNYINSS